MIFQQFPECTTGEELTNNLIKQIKPFNINFHLNERIEEIKNKTINGWLKQIKEKNLILQI